MVPRRGASLACLSLFLGAAAPAVAVGGAKGWRGGGLKFRSRGGEASGDDGGITLGELDEAMRNPMRGDPSGFLLRPIGGPDGALPADPGIFQRGERGDEEDGSSADSDSSERRRRGGLGRVSLDLSGRMLCHVVSPRDDDGADAGSRGDGGGSVPLLRWPRKREESAASGRTRRHWQRLPLPRVYAGADCDLDEVWYGVTRWIARCSWRGPSSSSPSTPKQAWRLDLEGERSAFDDRDATARMRLTQTLQRESPTVNDRRGTMSSLLAAVLPKGRRSFCAEYDSAKYFEAAPRAARDLRYAPTLSVDLAAPVLHPRLEVRSRHTWIVKHGGDRSGNYFGGEYFGCESSADRRMELARERFRTSVPRSSPSSNVPTGGAVSGEAPGRGLRTVWGRFSRWIEEDGWAPRKVTADLAGNLVSVNEVGLFGGDCENNEEDDERLPKPRGVLFPRVYGAGVRLRLSNRIDWTSSGLLPWSNKGGGGGNHQNRGNGASGGRGALGALRSTRVHLELRGLLSPSQSEGEESIASVGLRVDPSDWRGTWGVVATREGADFL